MSPTNEKTLETLAQALPIMTEAQKARIIGYAEGMADKAAESKEKEEQEDESES